MSRSRNNYRDSIAARSEPCSRRSIPCLCRHEPSIRYRRSHGSSAKAGKTSMQGNLHNTLPRDILARPAAQRSRRHPSTSHGHSSSRFERRRCRDTSLQARERCSQFVGRFGLCKSCRSQQASCEQSQRHHRGAPGRHASPTHFSIESDTADSTFQGSRGVVHGSRFVDEC